MLHRKRNFHPAVLLTALAAVLLTMGSGEGGQAVTPAHQASPPVRLTDPVPDPRQPGVQWFAPTGHIVRGAFLAYWTRYGGLAQFGYPLTEEFIEPTGPDNQPLTVQYFERARFEWHPATVDSPYTVLLGLLSTQLAQKRGYPYGWYPQYGHAADFSWVAGVLAPPRQCQAAECACPRFGYDERNSIMYSIGPGWQMARATA